MTQTDSQSLTIEIEFCKPSDITLEIGQPDVLEIVFTLPALFIDAQNFKRLGDLELTHEVQLVPQMTKEAYEVLVEKAQTA